SGNRIVPIGSACTSGLNDTRPSSRAVGSPRRSAVHACAASCTVSEKSSTANEMKTCAKLISKDGCDTTGVRRLRPTCEKRKDRIGRLCPDHGRQLFARRAAHAREAAERRQQRPAPARPDARNMIELRAQIAHRARAAMERDRESMRLVTNALHEQQRRIVLRKRDRILAI